MSTLKVSSIQSPSTTDGGLAISATGAVSGGLPTAGRQLLYNGAMQVAQRGTSATGITTNGYYTADRWITTGSGTQSTRTHSVVSDAPSGFANSFKILVTTANASPASNDLLLFNQTLEGYDVQRIAKGTSAAQQLTLSFWVKSNVTGTYVASIRDLDNARYVSGSYTINASATWEYKTVTFPADTTGVFDNDNAGSLVLSLYLMAGSDFNTAPLDTTWTTFDTTKRAAGQVNMVAAVNNYWQITGVQLETGPVATEFEHRSFGDELARCQRYYQPIATGDGAVYIGTGEWWSSSSFDTTVPFQPMRATPTLTASSGTGYYGVESGGSTKSGTTLVLANASPTGRAVFVLSGTSGGTAGYSGILRSTVSTVSVSLSAEL